MEIDDEMRARRAIWEPLQEALRRHLIGLEDVGLADLSGFDLTGVHGQGAQLWHVSLAGACLIRANLSGARFRRVDLTSAKLIEADLTECDLSDCEIEGVTWRDARYGAGTKFPQGFDPKAHGLLEAARAKISSSTFCEAVTLHGQAVSLGVRCGHQAEVARVIREQVLDVDLPATHRVNVAHGSCGMYSRYSLKQLKYAGGGDGGNCGYIEALAIKNPPSGHCPGIFHQYWSRRGYRFVEYDTPEQAEAAWETVRDGSDRPTSDLTSLAGSGKYLDWCFFAPWFYAVGGEEEFEERGFVLPRSMNDDPVFRLGTRWLVYSPEGWPRVVVCLGSRLERRTVRDTSWSERSQDVRVVYWHDGTTSEQTHPKMPPRRLEGDEPVWLSEARARIDQILTGEDDHAIVDLVNGARLTIRVNQPGVKRDRACRAGRYHYNLTLDRPVRGTVWVEDDSSEEGRRRVSREGVSFGGDFDFTPTAACPTPEAHVKKLVAGLPVPAEITWMEIKLLTPAEGGKRWYGTSEYWG